MFTKTDRFLIQNQQRPFVLREEQVTPSEDSSDFKPVLKDFVSDEEDRFIPIRSKLLKGITFSPSILPLKLADKLRS